MPIANSSASKEVVTASLLVIGGKILSGRTKDQKIGYVAEYLAAVSAIGSYPFFDQQHGPNTNVVLRARDAPKLAQAKREVEEMLERVRRAQSNSA